MYDPDLGLRRAPFHDAVDPDLFYPCPSHRTAARQLLAAALRTPGGVIALTGEPGTGKTTILRRVVRDVDKAGGRVLWGHALQSFDEMVAALVRSLGWAGSLVEPPEPEALRATLVAEARRHGPLVLAIDEAQHLELATLAGLSDMVNEAAAAGARFSMILAGHSELAGKLAATAAIGDRPRAVTEVGLPSLPPTEVGQYVEHRLWYAGCRQPHVFPPDAIAVVVARTQGVPRLVNQLCDDALRLARGAHRTTVSAALVALAARQLQSDHIGGVVHQTPPPGPEGRRSRERPSRTHRGRSPDRSARRLANWSEVGFTCVVFGLLAYVSHPRLVEVVVGGSGASPESVSPAEPTRLEPTAAPLARPQPAELGPRAILIDTPESPPVGSPPQQGVVRSQGEAKPQPTMPGARVERAALERPRSHSLSADERRLLDGAEDGDLGQVTALLAQGVSPDPRDDHGLTPLMLAVIQDHGAVARALLDRGASTRVRDRGGLTPLMFAAINDRLDLLQPLLAHRATVDARSAAGWTALTYATWEGHTSIARRLLAAGADPGATDRRGWTAARYAAWRASEAQSAAPSEDPGDVRRYTEILALLDEADRQRGPRAVPAAVKRTR